MGVGGAGRVGGLREEKVHLNEKSYWLTWQRGWMEKGEGPSPSDVGDKKNGGILDWSWKAKPFEEAKFNLGWRNGYRATVTRVSMDQKKPKKQII